MANTTTPKITKKAQYMAILDVLAAAEDAGFTLPYDDMTFTSLNAFITHEIELLDNKAVAAQARAEKKKAEGDELRETVYGVLTSEPMTVKDIVKAIGRDDVSDQMVVSRLTQLINADRVAKEAVSVGGDGVKSRKISAYYRA